MIIDLSYHDLFSLCACANISLKAMTVRTSNVYLKSLAVFSLVDSRVNFCSFPACSVEQRPQSDFVLTLHSVKKRKQIFRGESQAFCRQNKIQSLDLHVQVPNQKLEVIT